MRTSALQRDQTMGDRARTLLRQRERACGLTPAWSVMVTPPGRLQPGLPDAGLVPRAFERGERTRRAPSPALSRRACSPRHSRPRHSPAWPGTREPSGSSRPHNNAHESKEHGHEVERSRYAHGPRRAATPAEFGGSCGDGQRTARSATTATRLTTDPLRDTPGRRRSPSGCHRSCRSSGSICGAVRTMPPSCGPPGRRASSPARRGPRPELVTP
jgi:hypothetical protein